MDDKNVLNFKFHGESSNDNKKCTTVLYNNYISLGYFCNVALDLEKIGLRSFSYPFDWIISSIEGVFKAIDNNFSSFMDYGHLSQNIYDRCHYREDYYDFYFFHDFSKYKSLKNQYLDVKNKYLRRIERFFNTIKEPTLFIRYISSEDKDLDGKSLELKWIEDNIDYIYSVLRRYNNNNNIIFIGDEDIESNIIKIYNVTKDNDDVVSRKPIFSNNELFSYLNSALFVNKEKNIKIYKNKNRKKKVLKIKNKFVFCFQKIFFREYIHNKTYDIIGK